MSRKSRNCAGAYSVVRRTSNSADLSASGGLTRNCGKGPFMDGNVVYALLDNLTAQTLYSGIPEIGSRAAFVSLFAAASA